MQFSPLRPSRSLVTLCLTLGFMYLVRTEREGDGVCNLCCGAREVPDKERVDKDGVGGSKEEIHVPLRSAGGWSSCPVVC